ncbi:hypothetical protein DFP72DRAFT_840165 [Ephemerocybe angulata]|uniref:Carrier domain-containing protein n=1 Tax=Ephemerocybe angulata TaxID=980116 RepID=A0A8H6IIV0_9AGAR|nr:hypothetical protein DFP72DRAFT_840165 [Tulosesus angulatus]
MRRVVYGNPLNEDPPPADYPLAVEAVLHPEDDTLTIRAGSCKTSKPALLISTDFRTCSPNLQAWTSRLGVTRISQPIPSVDDAIPHGLRVTVSEFLGVDSKVLHDSTSFISLGLDSIKAVGLAKRITKLGYKVTSTEVLKGATIENPCSCNFGEDVGIRGSSDASRSSSQGRLRNDFGAYQIEVAFSMFITSLWSYPLALTFERLRSSWRIASDMFSILRTSFHFIHETGTWTQVVHSKCRLNWSSQETSSEEDFAAQLQELLSSPWDEDTAFVKPPLSLRLFIPSPSSTARPRLVLIIHHGLYDGLSLAKLMSTVESLYQENPLPSPVQFVSLLPEILHQERDGTEFWSQHLRGYRLAPLPRRPAASAIAYTARKRVILNTSVLASALSKTGVTLQCFFQAGLAKLLSSLTRSNDVVFGHVVSGRGIPGSEDVIGPMLNTIPCRVNLGGHESNLELLQKVHKSNLDVLSWQQASLRSVQKAMGLERLWDCLFAFQPMSIQNESIFKMESSDEESRLKIQYALHVEVEQEVNGFEIRAASHCDGFESRPLSSLVDDMAELFLVILDSVCDGKVGQEIPTPPAPLVIPVSSMSAAPPQYAHSPSAPQPSSVVEVLVELKSSIPPALLKILREVVPDAKDLNLETVLTSLGVDSISAIQVAAKCRRAGLPVKSADLINARTLGDVVAKLSPMPDKNGKVVKVEVEPKTITQNTIPIQEYNAIISRFGDLGDLIEQILPMTPGMKFLVSEWQRSRATKHQNTFPFSLPPDVDSLRLRNAWKLLFKRYPIVRSTCASAPGSGEPRLVTFKPDCGLEQWAEETLDDENFHHRLIDRLRDFSTKPLSIHRPPVRLILFRSRSRHRAYLCIHIHHLQYDATSFHLITKTLGDIYDILEPEGHGDITPWLSMFPLQASWKSSQEAYWKSALPSPFRPVLFPRLHTLRDLELKKTMKRHTIANTSVTLRVSDCDRKARALGTSLNAIILAVWASVHARYARSSGATFGLWQGGRSGLMDDVESLVAPCINITPVHVPSTGDILAVSRHLRDDLVRRSPEVVQSDFEDIHRWTRTEGSYLLNTTLNILRIPKSSEVERLLEPVKGPYTCPDIAAETITSTLDAVNYSKFHQDSLSVEVAIVEKTDQFFMAIEGDGTYITEDQTRRVLDDFVVEFMRVFSD